VVDERGQKTPETYETEEEATDVVRSLTKLLTGEEALTVEDALSQYEEHLHDKGNKERSIDTTLGRLKAFFSERGLLVGRLTPARCQGYYDALREKVAVDTHRNTLAQAKTFTRWCKSKGIISKDPLAAVEGKGRRKKGKEQLRIDEARKWCKKAHELASGEAGAVAALITLLMGLRASEIVERVVRDVDDGGRLLWIPDSKTEAGKRTVKVPEELRPYLLQLCEGKKGNELLFGKHWRDWPREWVQRICGLAKVPRVTAHGMRGLHATLGEESGATPEMVATTLGHVSVSTTHAHYTKRSAVDGARQERMLTVLEGGR